MSKVCYAMSIGSIRRDFESSSVAIAVGFGHRGGFLCVYTAVVRRWRCQWQWCGCGGGGDSGGGGVCGGCGGDYYGDVFTLTHILPWSCLSPRYRLLSPFPVQVLDITLLEKREDLVLGIIPVKNIREDGVLARAPSEDIDTNILSRTGSKRVLG